MLNIEEDTNGASLNDYMAGCSRVPFQNTDMKVRKPSLESHTECVFSLMKFTKGNSHVLLFMQDIAPYHAVCNTMEAIHSAVIETIGEDD
ncbi:hypothetical protein HI914_02914 [Erysiphe necator]|nr:hypothetical protein HI914_02914 [Erysiphe necator]